MTIWTEKRYAEAEKQRKKKLFLFLLVTALWFAAMFSLLLFSPDDYTLYLVLDIVLTVLCGWFAVYFFTVVYAAQRAKCRLYRSMCNAVVQTENVVFLRRGEDKNRNGVPLPTLVFLTPAGDVREISLPPATECPLNGHVNYRIRTRKNVLVYFEATDEEDTAHA